MNAIDDIRGSDAYDPFDLNVPQPQWEEFRKEKPIFFH